MIPSPVKEMYTDISEVTDLTQSNKYLTLSPKFYLKAKIIDKQKERVAKKPIDHFSTVKWVSLKNGIFRSIAPLNKQ